LYTGAMIGEGSPIAACSGPSSTSPDFAMAPHELP